MKSKLIVNERMLSIKHELILSFRKNYRNRPLEITYTYIIDK